MTDKELTFLVINKNGSLQHLLESLKEFENRGFAKKELEEVGCIFYKKYDEEQAFLNLKSLLRYPYY